MIKRSWLITLAVLVFIITLLVQTPASLVYQLFHEQLDGAQLNDVRGTVWDGQAGTFQSGELILQQLQWQLAPWPLFTGSVALQLDSQDPDYPLRGHVTISPGGELEISSLTGRLPASIIRQIRMLSFVGISGTLDIRLDHLQQSNGEISSASGEIQLLDGALQQPIQAQLGHLLLTITTENDQVHVQIRDRQAPIGVRGKLLLKPGRQYEFSANLTPTPSASQVLVSMLRNVARPQNDGSLKINHSGIY